MPVLGDTAALWRTLRTTNPIENLNGSAAHYCRNVKRWGSKLPRQVDNQEVESSAVNTLGLNRTAGTSPRDSCGRYSW